MPALPVYDLDLITRRSLLLASPGLARARERVRREVFLASPAAGTAVMADAYYTRPQGGAMLSIEHRFSRSDTVDAAYYRHSRDHGHSWSAPVAHSTGERRPAGMWRRHPRACHLDPASGRFLEFWVEGVLPTDDPLEGMRQWNIFYRVDGGAACQLIHEGAEFDALHPLPGVYTGRNCVMLGDVASLPLTLRDGTILLPAITSPLRSDGQLYNPTEGYTYTDALLLHGRWHGTRLTWRAAEPVKGDPQRSTRGMDEPTLAHLAGGRILMLLRGSNDRNPALPGYRWMSTSNDGGWHWTEPRPWTYTAGQAFFSPSACSQLLQHSNGRLYWVGHITPSNPRGNRPRYPVVLGEVDQASGLLIRDSVIPIDDRHPDEDEILMIYPPYAREDRRTREIALHMSRIFAFREGWKGDALLYRISV
jgi:hypothetical protein